MRTYEVHSMNPTWDHARLHFIPMTTKLVKLGQSHTLAHAHVHTCADASTNELTGKLNEEYFNFYVTYFGAM